MNNIIEVNSEEKELLFKIVREKKCIGEDAEGNCYLGKDEFGRLEVIKINDKETRYGIANVLLDSVYNIKSFAFPKKVYLEDGKVVAYTSRYYTDFLKPSPIDGCPFIINSELFKNGLSRFIDDLKYISELGIHINDLSYNLVFDNYNLVAINTLGYEIRDYNTFNENIKTLKEALKETFKYKSNVILDMPFDFDEEVEHLLGMKDGSYIKKYLKNMSR